MREKEREREREWESANRSKDRERQRSKDCDCCWYFCNRKRVMKTKRVSERESVLQVSKKGEWEREIGKKQWMYTTERKGERVRERARARVHGLFLHRRRRRWSRLTNFLSLRKKKSNKTKSGSSVSVGVGVGVGSRFVAFVVERTRRFFRKDTILFCDPSNRETSLKVCWTLRLLGFWGRTCKQLVCPEAKVSQLCYV